MNEKEEKEKEIKGTVLLYPTSKVTWGSYS